MRANERIQFIKRVLDKSGLGGDRVNLYQCSAAEVNRFVEAVEDTIAHLQKLGPNPIRVKA
ncbi:MAG: hydrogenase iron-sulfur subunit [Candidatus Helarchaeota archaeon]|nr:hydrogenase iron-sulfur subunit [Candidatus Helarchaeota archaeon]